jgi:HNH endonuclease
MRPSRDELRRMLDYDPEAGVLRWRYRPERQQKWNTKWVGKIAGFDSCVGSRQVCIDNRKYYEHRVIWCWMTGHWPTNQIDHKDTDPHNNRWTNLREATGSQNMANQGLRSTNTSGIKGVSWSKREKKWVAMITKEHKQRRVAASPCIAAAWCAYQIAAAADFGKFARFV